MAQEQEVVKTPGAAAGAAGPASVKPQTRRGGSFFPSWDRMLSVIGLLSGAAVAILMKHGLPDPELTVGFERNTTRLPHEADIVQNDYMRTTVYVPSVEGQEVQLEAWLYEPLPSNPASPPPVIVMSHGLGCQRDMGLHAYAEQFAQAGMAVVVPDYRGFGGSDGAVRHWVSWRRHLQDVQSVLDHVAQGRLAQGKVDARRIGLWGVSYSGGLMLMLASNPANHDKVKVVVANEPYVAGAGDALTKAVRERGVVVVARLLAAALLDKAREYIGGDAIYVRLIGPYGKLAVLNVNDHELSQSASAQKDPPPRIGGWKNVIAARMLVDNLSYKPIKHLHHVQCPVLLIAGEADEITPASRIEEAQRIIGDKATLLMRPWSHIEMHRRMSTPEELVHVIEYLRQHLGLVPAHAETHPHETQEELDRQAPEVV